jgi:CIC family chloride channel protein
VSGLLARWAPEIGGGGGDQTIEAFHRHEARVRRRVLPLKWLASVATLACGGAGGREGPGMQLGSACGSVLAGVLPVSGRERRLLFVAGLAAGISAVFRTPLGAALFAVEVLYRDDFETDALVPAVLASVVGFAVSDRLLGRHVLFGALPSYPFVVRHLPLYGGLAIVASLAGVLFVEALRGVRRLAGRHALPGWAAPAAGGLLRGGVLLLLHLGGLDHVGPVSADSALLGGGYGLAQVAVRQGGGAPLALAGWFLLLAAMRIAATALTVGSGASAGDFAPALLVGALVGAAFGHAAQGVLQDPSLQPGAFALVGMAALYGGVAHAPLSAVVLVSELTGSYDLLVPLMLAVGAAHVLLRKVSLYPSQEVNRRRATLRAQGRGPPGDEGPRSPLAAPHPPRAVLSADPAAPLSALRGAAAAGQPVVPLVDAGGRYVGLVDGKTLLTLATEPDLPGVVALDVAGPALAIQVGESVRSAADRLLASESGHLPLCEDGRIVGLVSLTDVLRAAAGKPPNDGP